MITRSIPFRGFFVPAILACGALAFIGAVVGFTVSAYQATSISRRTTISLGFLANGEPILNRRILAQNFRTATDLDGHPISLENETETARVANLPAGPPPVDQTARLVWYTRIVGFMDNQQPPNYWYLMHDGKRQGQAYFVGYSAASLTRVGFIGTAGQRSDAVPAAELFPLRGGRNWNGTQISCAGGTHSMASAPMLGVARSAGPDSFPPWIVFVNSGSEVYLVNLGKREVRPVLTEPHSPVINLEIGGRSGIAGVREWLAMRTADALHFYYPDGTLKTLPLAPELQGRDLRVAARSEGGFTVAAAERADYAGLQEISTVFVMADDGQLSPGREISETLAPPGDPFCYETPLVAASPAMLVSALAVDRTRQLLSHGLAGSWSEALRIALGEYSLYLLATLVAGTALAVACFQRQTRCHTGAASRIGWTLFVFLFGLPGWIGYRYGRRWPPLDVCPACHELAPRDQEICPSCGDEFPLPEPKGTEIFA